MKLKLKRVVAVLIMCMTLVCVSAPTVKAAES